MNRDWAESIVQCLRLDGDVELYARRLARFRESQWRRGQYWLDWTGLPLYLLAALESRRMAELLPAQTRARLQQNRDDNRARNLGMREETFRIAAEFRREGISFAAMKGVTLFPVACPDMALRQQSDLDFLVYRADLARVDVALQWLGYQFGKRYAETSTYSRQLGFVPRHADIYRPGTHHPVEIHTVLWEFPEDVGAPPPIDLLARSCLSDDGLPVLHPVDQFLHQAVHVMEHVVRFWVRICWLYELARTIDHYRADPDFWEALKERCREQPNYATLVCASIALAQQLFGVALPQPAAAWVDGSVSGAIARWIAEYGRECVLTQYPGTKLTMLLHRELMRPELWAHYEREKLFPLHRPSHANLRAQAATRESLVARIRQWRYAGRRGLFHCTEAVRYLYARWRWDRRLLRDGRARSAMVAVRD